MKSLYSIYDSKMKSYGTVFQFTNDVECKRLLVDAFYHNKGSMQRKYPSDFLIVKIGHFDDYSGVASGCDHVILCSMADLFSEYENYVVNSQDSGDFDEI